MQPKFKIDDYVYCVDIINNHIGFKKIKKVKLEKTEFYYYLGKEGWYHSCFLFPSFDEAFFKYIELRKGESKP